MEDNFVKSTHGGAMLDFDIRKHNIKSIYKHAQNLLEHFWEHLFGFLGLTTPTWYLFS